MKSTSAFLVLFLSSIIALSQESQSLKTDTSIITKSNKTDEPFVYVTEMPEYIGGTSALYTFVGKNIKYPKKARKKGITGKGFYRFVVDTNGLVSKVEIQRGVPNCGECDKEAVRVIKMLAFTPGKNNGEKVRVWYNLPINFTLRD